MKKSTISGNKIYIESYKDQFEPSYGKVSLAKDWIRKSRIQSLLKAKQKIKNKKPKSLELDVQITYMKEHFKRDTILTLKDSIVLGKQNQNVLVNDKVLKKEENRYK